MSSKKSASLNKFKVVLGYTLLFTSIVLFISFISYMFNWKVDQSNVNSLFDRDIQVENILGKVGASISHFFIFKLFGIGSFVIPIILLLSSYFILFNKKILLLIKNISWLLVLMIWTIIFSGYISDYYPLQTGIVGFELNLFLKSYIGDTGIIIILSFILLTSAAVLWNLTPNSF